MSDAEIYDEDIAAELEIAPEHRLKEHDVTLGRMTRTIDFTLKGSPESIAARAAEIGEVVDRVHENSADFFKYNKATSNRTQLRTEHLVGDPTHGVPLSAKVVHVTNTLPFDIGINVSDFVPTCLRSDTGKQYTYIAKAGVNAPVEKSFCEPNNVITRNMLDSSNTLFSGPQEISKMIGANVTGGHDIVKDTAAHMLFDDMLYHGEIEIGNDVDESTKVIHVSREVGSKVEQELRERFGEIEDSFMDLTKLSCKFERADGKQWNDMQGTIGSSTDPTIAAGGPDSYVINHNRTSEQAVCISVEITYGLF